MMRGMRWLPLLLLVVGCRSSAEPTPSGRRVPILVTDDGYEPATLRATPNERVQLVFSRYSQAPCADRVVIGHRTVVLPEARIELVDVTAPAQGQLEFGCPTKRLLGKVVVANEVDPGLEHPLIAKPLPLDHAASRLGVEAPPWQVGEWNGAAPMTLASLRGRVVVVRFYMDECPFCRATLPALDAMRASFEGEPVTFVGLFHSKPRGTESDWGTALRTARTWGARFPLGYDHHWNTLASWYGEDLLKRSPTSVTFVIDAEGRFAFIHPGPVYHPSEHPDHRRCQEDYDAVRAAIAEAIAAAKR